MTRALGAALDAASLVLDFLGERRVLRELGDDSGLSRDGAASGAQSRPSRRFVSQTKCPP